MFERRTAQLDQAARRDRPQTSQVVAGLVGESDRELDVRQLMPRRAEVDPGSMGPGGLAASAGLAPGVPASAVPGVLGALVASEAPGALAA